MAISWRQCAVCYDNVRLAYMPPQYILRTCSKRHDLGVCFICLDLYIHKQLETRGRAACNSIRCPQPHCNHMYNFNEIKNITSPETFSHYDELLTRKVGQLKPAQAFENVAHDNVASLRKRLQAPKELGFEETEAASDPQTSPRPSNTRETRTTRTSECQSHPSPNPRKLEATATSETRSRPPPIPQGTGTTGNLNRQSALDQKGAGDGRLMPRGSTTQSQRVGAYIPPRLRLQVPSTTSDSPVHNCDTTSRRQTATVFTASAGISDQQGDRQGSDHQEAAIRNTDDLQEVRPPINDVNGSSDLPPHNGEEQGDRMPSSCTLS